MQIASDSCNFAIDYNLKEKMNILIIGATSGIGHELWRHYVAAGNNVAVIARRLDILKRMQSEYPENTFCFPCDMASIEDTEIALKRIFSELKSIDKAFLCAGIGELNPDLDPETEQSVISVNVSGWTALMDNLYRRFADAGGGHIIALTSVGGMQPSAIAPSYSASKAFQINYVRSLQSKASGSQIKITEVRPGLVDTRMAKGDGLFWVMPLDKVVRYIIIGVDRRKRRIIVTRRWRIINFLLRHFF